VMWALCEAMARRIKRTHADTHELQYDHPLTGEIFESTSSLIHTRTHWMCFISLVLALPTVAA